MKKPPAYDGPRQRSKAPKGRINAGAPVVRGEYNRNGYDIWIAGRVVYAAGNHFQDSSQYATFEQDSLPLKTIRKFCIKTAREVASEHRGRFAGVERVADGA